MTSPIDPKSSSDKDLPPSRSEPFVYPENTPMVWITQGKTDHAAYILKEHNGRKFVRWAASELTQWVEADAEVKTELPKRRKGRRESLSSDFVFPNTAVVDKPKKKASPATKAKAANKKAPQSSSKKSTGGKKRNSSTQGSKKSNAVKKRKSAASNHKYPLGTQVYKEFPPFGWFIGEVVEMTDDNLYHIIYEDEDEESLNEAEMDEIVVENDSIVDSTVTKQVVDAPLEEESNTSLKRIEQTAGENTASEGRHSSTRSTSEGPFGTKKEGTSTSDIESRYPAQQVENSSKTRQHALPDSSETLQVVPGPQIRPAGKQLPLKAQLSSPKGSPASQQHSKSSAMKEGTETSINSQIGSNKPLTKRPVQPTAPEDEPKKKQRTVADKCTKTDEPSRLTKNYDGSPCAGASAQLRQNESPEGSGEKSTSDEINTHSKSLETSEKKIEAQGTSAPKAMTQEDSLERSTGKSTSFEKVATAQSLESTEKKIEAMEISTRNATLQGTSSGILAEGSTCDKSEIVQKSLGAPETNIKAAKEILEIDRSDKSYVAQPLRGSGRNSAERTELSSNNDQSGVSHLASVDTGEISKRTQKIADNGSIEKSEMEKTDVKETLHDNRGNPKCPEIASRKLISSTADTLNQSDEADQSKPLKRSSEKAGAAELSSPSAQEKTTRTGDSLSTPANELVRDTSPLSGTGQHHGSKSEDAEAPPAHSEAIDSITVQTTPGKAVEITEKPVSTVHNNTTLNATQLAPDNDNDRTRNELARLNKPDTLRTTQPTSALGTKSGGIENGGKQQATSDETVDEAKKPRTMQQSSTFEKETESTGKALGKAVSAGESDYGNNGANRLTPNKPKTTQVESALKKKNEDTDKSSQGKSGNSGVQQPTIAFQTNDEAITPKTTQPEAATLEKKSEGAEKPLNEADTAGTSKELQVAPGNNGTNKSAVALQANVEACKLKPLKPASAVRKNLGNTEQPLGTALTAGMSKALQVASGNRGARGLTPDEANKHTPLQPAVASLEKKSGIAVLEKKSGDTDELPGKPTSFGDKPKAPQGTLADNSTKLSTPLKQVEKPNLAETTSGDRLGSLFLSDTAMKPEVLETADKANSLQPLAENKRKTSENQLATTNGSGKSMLVEKAPRIGSEVGGNHLQNAGTRGVRSETSLSKTDRTEQPAKFHRPIGNASESAREPMSTASTPKDAQPSPTGNSKLSESASIANEAMATQSTIGSKAHSTAAKASMGQASIATEKPKSLQIKSASGASMGACLTESHNTDKNALSSVTKPDKISNSVTAQPTPGSSSGKSPSSSEVTGHFKPVASSSEIRSNSDPPFSFREVNELKAAQPTSGSNAEVSALKTAQPTYEGGAGNLSPDKAVVTGPTPSRSAKKPPSLAEKSSAVSASSNKSTPGGTLLSTDKPVKSQRAQPTRDTSERVSMPADTTGKPVPPRQRESTKNTERIAMFDEPETIQEVAGGGEVVGTRSPIADIFQTPKSAPLLHDSGVGRSLSAAAESVLPKNSSPALVGKNETNKPKSALHPPCGTLKKPWEGQLQRDEKSNEGPPPRAATQDKSEAVPPISAEDGKNSNLNATISTRDQVVKPSADESSVMKDASTSGENAAHEKVPSPVGPRSSGSSLTDTFADNGVSGPERIDFSKADNSILVSAKSKNVQIAVDHKNNSTNPLLATSKTNKFIHPENDTKTRVSVSKRLLPSSTKTNLRVGLGATPIVASPGNPTLRNESNSAQPALASEGPGPTARPSFSGERRDSTDKRLQSMDTSRKDSSTVSVSEVRTEKVEAARLDSMVVAEARSARVDRLMTEHVSGKIGSNIVDDSDGHERDAHILPDDAMDRDDEQAVNNMSKADSSDIQRASSEPSLISLSGAVTEPNTQQLPAAFTEVERPQVEGDRTPEGMKGAKDGLKAETGTHTTSDVPSQPTNESGLSVKKFARASNGVECRQDFMLSEKSTASSASPIVLSDGRSVAVTTPKTAEEMPKKLSPDNEFHGKTGAAEVVQEEPEKGNKRDFSATVTAKEMTKAVSQNNKVHQKLGTEESTREETEKKNKRDSPTTVAQNPPSPLPWLLKENETGQPYSTAETTQGPKVLFPSAGHTPSNTQTQSGANKTTQNDEKERDDKRVLTSPTMVTRSHSNDPTSEPASSQAVSCAPVPVAAADEKQSDSIQLHIYESYNAKPGDSHSFDQDDSSDTVSEKSDRLPEASVVCNEEKNVGKCEHETSGLDGNNEEAAKNYSEAAESLDREELLGLASALVGLPFSLPTKNVEEGDSSDKTGQPNRGAGTSLQVDDATTSRKEDNARASNKISEPQAPKEGSSLSDITEKQAAKASGSGLNKSEAPKSQRQQNQEATRPPPPLAPGGYPMHNYGYSEGTKCPVCSEHIDALIYSPVDWTKPLHYPQYGYAIDAIAKHTDDCHKEEPIWNIVEARLGMEEHRKAMEEHKRALENPNTPPQNVLTPEKFCRIALRHAIGCSFAIDESLQDMAKLRDMFVRRMGIARGFVQWSSDYFLYGRTCTNCKGDVVPGFEMRRSALLLLAYLEDHVMEHAFGKNCHITEGYALTYPLPRWRNMVQNVFLEPSGIENAWFMEEHDRPYRK